MPALFGPNNSDVIDTADENMNPELSPIKAVAALRAVSDPEVASRKNAIGVNTSAAASQPVLAKWTLLHFV